MAMNSEALSKELVLIEPLCRERSKTERISTVLNNALSEKDYELITTSEEFSSMQLQNKKLIFAISLGESGINLEYYNILKKIRLDRNCFSGCTGAVIVDGNSEFYTKDVARHLVFSANMSGCTFIGKPLVEGTRSLDNFGVIARIRTISNMDAYVQQGKDLIERLIHFNDLRKEHPALLMLHAGNSETSNSLMLWGMVKKYLRDAGITIREISLKNGQMVDCRGCPYSTCLHYGEKSSCFYGGVIVEQVYPAIIECDALLMICSNYNDAVSANISAFINRLTAPFRANDFSAKKLFAIIVSGYSGGDILAQQLISGINMNKSFVLPERFAMLETANNPLSIGNLEGIEDRAAYFAHHMISQMMPCCDEASTQLGKSDGHKGGIK